MPEDSNATPVEYNQLTLYKYQQTPRAVNVS